jgi:hypothetical protein
MIPSRRRFGVNGLRSGCPQFLAYSGPAHSKGDRGAPVSLDGGNHSDQASPTSRLRKLIMGITIEHV